MSYLHIGDIVRGRMLGGRVMYEQDWTPAQLFAGGQQGVWYSAADLSTSFADSARTTVAGVGGSVGGVTDKSGNGNHAYQDTVSAQPTLQRLANGRYVWRFDGVDDFLNFGPIAAFSNSDFMFVMAMTPVVSAGMPAEMRDNTDLAARVFWLQKGAGWIEAKHTDSTGDVPIQASSPAAVPQIATIAQSGLTFKLQSNHDAVVEAAITNTVPATGRPHTLGCRTTNAGSPGGFAQVDIFGVVAVPYWDAAALIKAQLFLAQEAGVAL